MQRLGLIGFILAVGALAARAEAAPIVVIEVSDPVRQAACAGVKPAQEWRACFYKDANRSKWSIQIIEGPGPPGTGNFFVPDAIKVLQRIVDRCKLGETFYVRATDGMASLHLPELNQEQIRCIKAAERPGVRLRDN